MTCCRATLAIVVFGGFLATAAAEDAFYNLSVQQLKLTDGTLPEAPAQFDRVAMQRWPAMQPYAVLDVPGEVYFETSQNAWTPWTDRGTWGAANGFIAVRAERGRAVAGRLFVPKSDFNGMVALQFSVDPSAAKDEDRAAFLRAKAGYYEGLLARGLPGGAWFRHESRLARSALDPDDKRLEDQGRQAFINRRGDFDDTFALFSGGRAVSENLQLDRALLPTKAGDETVELSTLAGITVKEIDWTTFIKDLHPKTDPLAALVPADQHAVLFPSFAALLDVADEFERHGTPVFRLLDARAEDEQIKARYERQLGLSLSMLARLLGPAIVESVAITGSDPYFFAGTDVAVLFETKRPDALKSLLAAKITLAAHAEKDVEPVKGQAAGVAYAGFRTADRRVSSYLARFDRAVVVTNSLTQLERLAETASGKTPALASLDEYTFFRGRYPRGDEEESALVLLSDATIRRWCGPQWRIADSRRTREAAVIGQLQADFLDQLVAGKAESGAIHTELPLAGVGELRLAATGVRSSALGTLEFLTPIVELPHERVSKAEADAYIRWRDGYQNNWRWSFDPIALRLGVHDRKLSADLTVMPLIWGSDYRELAGVAQGAEIKSSSGDPHETLAHLVLAFNVKSPNVQRGANFAVSMLQVNPLDWLGSSLAVYAEDDEFWGELASLDDPTTAEELVSHNMGRLPVALYCEVSNPLKLTAFLTALRGLIEQTAPRMVVWETRTHRDEPYVKVSVSERAKAELPPTLNDPAVYYAFSSAGLIVTPNEPLLQRYLDRQIARRTAKSEGKEPPPAARPWLGSSLCAQFDRKLLEMLGALTAGDYRATMQLRSWGNLPILNEWHRRYPDHDPVELHAKFWQTRLVCPGGGTYVWNDEWQTMESTTYGHPGEPKPGPAVTELLQMIRGVNLGLSFEDQGLRAKAEVERE
jgi:hypothetical protein